MQTFPEIRRVVTSHDSQGMPQIAYGPPPNTVTRPGGIVSTLLWVTREMPAKPGVDGEDRAIGDIGRQPPPMGSIFRIVDFPPMVSEAMAHDVHRTNSVDYALVLEGEIDLMLDQERIHLKKGDTVVQQGTMHAWVNRSKGVCRMAFVQLDAVATKAPVDER